MNKLRELLPGCILLEPKRFEDARGAFVKTYHADTFAEFGVRFDTLEEFYSISYKGVVRGMHFQLPPHDHDKLVYCTRGAVLDVLLDLRSGSGYGRVAAVELSEDNLHEVFIPKGIAHGFVALRDQTMMLYKTSTMHAPAADAGIRWDSFGFDWRGVNPVVSDRDAGHPAFAEFVTPF
jgi:dTDP-4-dehydrorhamnose 3,5-epimerase